MHHERNTGGNTGQLCAGDEQVFGVPLVMPGEKTMRGTPAIMQPALKMLAPSGLRPAFPGSPVQTSSGENPLRETCSG
jgi:hypothetical protein